MRDDHQESTESFGKFCDEKKFFGPLHDGSELIYDDFLLIKTCNPGGRSSENCGLLYDPLDITTGVRKLPCALGQAITIIFSPISQLVSVYTYSTLCGNYFSWLIADLDSILINYTHLRGG